MRILDNTSRGTLGGATTSVVVVVLSGLTGVFMDNELVHVVRDASKPTDFSWIGLYASDEGQCEFGDFVVWSLVDFRPD